MAKKILNQREKTSNTENKNFDKVIQPLKNSITYQICKKLGCKFQLKGYSREDGEKIFSTTKIQEAINILHFFNNYEKIIITVEFFLDTEEKVIHEKIFKKQNHKFSDIVNFIEKYQYFLLK